MCDGILFTNDTDVGNYADDISLYISPSKTNPTFVDQINGF